MDVYDYVAQVTQLPVGRVEKALVLLDAGNTVPFIARYRKEATGSLNETDLRRIVSEAAKFRALAARKEDVLRLIAEQGKLTLEIEQAVRRAATLQAVEDQYRPFRPKRRTRADAAKELGLAPLAEAALSPRAQWSTFERMAIETVKKHPEVLDVNAASAGAADIIAELVADDPRTREQVRAMTTRYGMLICRCGLKEEQRDERTPYETYYEFQQPINRLRSYQVLAINRGERESVLKVRLQAPTEQIDALLTRLWVRTTDSKLGEFLKETLRDAYKRLLAPAIERDIRNSLSETAGEQAIQVFAKNLTGLLMQAPVRGLRVLGVDPGFRTGCKLAAVDDTGKVLAVDVIYPHPPQNKWEAAQAKLQELIEKWRLQLVAIGNGTASRETEMLVAEVIRELPDVNYMIVSEAGASVYSASELAGVELPDYDVTERGAVSIARRVLDPLAELVKIEPKAIGVGQYQHDVNQKALAEELDHVVESCVNQVGVHVNTASPALLRYVAGINATIGQRIAAYRDEHGPFQNRQELLQVKGLGPKSFEQAAGFLRIPDGTQPLDGTAVHPESYDLAEAVLAQAQLSVADIKAGARIGAVLQQLDPLELAAQLQAGVPTITDIIAALSRPGLDPRSELPSPPFRRDILRMEDLRPGMRLTGTVTNVVDFGAFVDLGLKKAGLIHRSKMGRRFVEHPLELLTVGEAVTVDVLDVDEIRGRIALELVSET
ncbi:MAG TPA: RNA-binding transcriptional accessory protein [Firmicutes bacterium]|nr:RNA-binding transcriptional accessory protein [Bacillota bacterium]